MKAYECTKKELHPGCFAGNYAEHAEIFGAVIFSKHQWTDDCECSNSLLLEHQWTPLDGYIGNRREISICTKVVLTP